MIRHTSLAFSKGLLLAGAVLLPVLASMPASARMRHSRMTNGRMKGMTMSHSRMMRGMSARDKRAMRGMSSRERRAMMNAMRMHGNM